MKRVFALTLRVVWLMVVYVVAVHAAGAIAVLPSSSVWTIPAHEQLDAVAVAIDTALLVGLVGAMYSHAFFIPAILAITVAEVFRIRGALAHLLGGVGVAAYAGNYTHLLSQTDVSTARAWELLLAAGVIAGAIFWALAGRNAGRWKDDDAPAGRPAEPSADRS